MNYIGLVGHEHELKYIGLVGHEDEYLARIELYRTCWT